MTRSVRDIPYWLEMAEANAWADMVSALAEAGDALGGHVDSSNDGVTFALRSIDLGFFNRSVGLGAGRPATRSAIRRILRTFRDAGQTTFTIQVSPFARPSAIETWLEAAGMRRGGRWAKVWRDILDPPPERTDLRIEAIGPEHREGWNKVTLTAFEFPDLLTPFGEATLGRSDWHHFLAFDGDQAVGAGALYVMGDVGWLGFGATLESHRGRGSQSAIFARRIRAAADLGVKLLITETGEELPDRPNPSYRNMLRAGFRLAYARQNWLEPAAPDAPED